MKFILPSSQRIYRIRYPSGERLNLNPLQRLNRIIPELSFVSLAPWRFLFHGLRH
jgi:hypothetical protein